MRAAVLALVALLARQELSAQLGSRAWRADERMVIDDFSYVEAIAAADEVVFVASRGGLGTYDPRFRQWKPPVTWIDGYPSERVLSAIVDPIDRSLWLGTAQGLVHYQPVLRTFESILVPGGAGSLMFDRENAIAGMYVRVGGRWLFLPRGSLAPLSATSLPGPGRRLTSTGAPEVLARLPFASAMTPLTLTDERMRQYRYTAGAAVPVSDLAFLGTDGMGVLLVDAATTNIEPLPFGLLASPVGAVVATSDGVWAGTGRGALRVGFTVVSEDAQDYRYEEGPRATGFRFTEVRDAVATQREVWAATDAGVVRLSGRGEGRPLDTSAGLPTDDAYTLARGRAGLWIGTARGLVYAADDGVVERVDTRVVDPVLALVAVGDTVWIGTARGLAVTWRGTGDILIPPEVEQTPQLRDPIVALAWSGDTLVAATPQRILWRAPGAGWVVERVMGEVGQIVALAGDADGVWIGGPLGIAFYRFRSRDLRAYNAPGDLPGPVRDLAVDRSSLWVATGRGLVRFARRALLP